MPRAAGRSVGPGQAFIAFLMVGVATIATSRAHDPGISTAEAHVYVDRIEITTGFAPGDADHFLPPALRAGSKWSEDDFEPARASLLAIAPGLWEVRDGGAVLTPREVKVELLPEDNVSFLLVFPRGRDGGGLMLHAPKLGELPASHRQFLIVADERGSTLGKKLLRAGDASVEVPLGATKPTAGVAADDRGARVSNAAAFWGFLKLGVEHIWTGYDHLLFLFALLVVCRSFRSIVGIVSCFTLAHSITLALATLDLVALPATLVEPAIAASIVYVGVENLWRRGEEPRGRWALTFVFGLIHGFGFAGVLRDLGIGRTDGEEGIAMPLFSFNLGVEVGQVAIAAVVLPIVWRLRKRQGFARRGVPILSALVALAGLYWLMERTLLG